MKKALFTILIACMLFTPIRVSGDSALDKFRFTKSGHVEHCIGGAIIGYSTTAILRRYTDLEPGLATFIGASIGQSAGLIYEIGQADNVDWWGGYASGNDAGITGICSIGASLGAHFTIKRIEYAKPVDSPVDIEPSEIEDPKLEYESDKPTLREE